MTSLTQSLRSGFAVRCAALAASLGISTVATGQIRVAAAPTIELIAPRVWRCTFDSVALARRMVFAVVLPEATGSSVPCVYLLHGRGRDEMTLLNDEYGRAALLAMRCATVLPRGLDGWYIDSPVFEGERFASYLDEVIVTAERAFPLRRSADSRAIAGWSMGGYGAAYTFCRRGGDFAALGTIIGILDYPRVDIEPAAQNYPVQPRFGSEAAVWREYNPRLLLTRTPHRPMIVAYAEGAAEREMNESFIAQARAHGFSVEELRLPGEHVFAVVREALPLVLRFLERQLLRATDAPLALTHPSPADRQAPAASGAGLFAAAGIPRTGRS